MSNSKVPFIGTITDWLSNEPNTSKDILTAFWPACPESLLHLALNRLSKQLRSK
ncbi:MAG: hypothetical protein IPG87_12645 [Saprospiraceae bacterium]|nr:hypothetical protein [Candidatus Vicinibacter affinis]